MKKNKQSILNRDNPSELELLKSAYKEKRK